MKFDVPNLARGWLSVAQASANDKDLPTLHRTIALEVFPNGLRLVATDRYILLSAWVPDLGDTDEPELWHKDLTGQIEHWIDVGQPDDKRLMKAAGRARKVSLYAFQSSTNVWWGNIASKLTRAQNLTVWQIPTEQSQALATLAKRSMQLQFTVQDGTQLWENPFLRPEMLDTKQG
mgnify:CR=1 FL=1